MRIILAFLITSNLFFSQEYNWNELEKNVYISIIYENCEITFNEKDSVEIDIFEFQSNEKVDLERDSGNIHFKLPYEKINDKLFYNFDYKFCKNSEYLIKLDFIFNKISLELYLYDNITDNELEKLKTTLNEIFGKENIKYTSKEEAFEIAKNELGIEFINDIKENIFPASFNLKIPNSQKNQNIVNKFIEDYKDSKYIEEIKADNFLAKKLIAKIKT